LSGFDKQFVKEISIYYTLQMFTYTIISNDAYLINNTNLHVPLEPL